MRIDIQKNDLRSLRDLEAAVARHFDAARFPKITVNRNGTFLCDETGQLIFGQFHPDVRRAVDALSARRPVRPFSFELDIS